MKIKEQLLLVFEKSRTSKATRNTCVLSVTVMEGMMLQGIELLMFARYIRSRTNGNLFMELEPVHEYRRRAGQLSVACVWKTLWDKLNSQKYSKYFISGFYVKSVIRPVVNQSVVRYTVYEPFLWHL